MCVLEGEAGDGHKDSTQQGHLPQCLALGRGVLGMFSVCDFLGWGGVRFYDL